MKIVLIALLFVACIYSSHAENQIICEGQTISIECPVGYAINIQKASYGRTDTSTCPHTSIQTSNCAAGGSHAIINDVCHGQQSCSLSANNSVFGDPCYGTYKYVNVKYECTNPYKAVPHVNVICEGSNGVISCGSGERIGVLDAFYGRSNKLTCPHSQISNTNCASSGSFNSIRNFCHGQQTCSLSASNGVYGDPCYGTYKYIKVTYVCYYP
uniref:SUEL-type lectin domain-containing protein n=1 Tax=Ciona savignyi TaxID=51511 RepID=H2ZPP7_CIOSA